MKKLISLCALFTFVSIAIFAGGKGDVTVLVANSQGYDINNASPENDKLKQQPNWINKPGWSEWDENSRHFIVVSVKNKQGMSLIHVVERAHESAIKGMMEYIHTDVFVATIDTGTAEEGLITIVGSGASPSVIFRDLKIEASYWEKYTMKNSGNDIEYYYFWGKYSLPLDIVVEERERLKEAEARRIAQ